MVLTTKDGLKKDIGLNKFVINRLISERVVRIRFFSTKLLAIYFIE